ncbi:uncharacterized protein BJ212DRAFT_887360 [Suillus subaureus]|uniref:Secreted protein n=1 Tax=Suillus subaureus TaxID=48587 RepID=A0A9P7DFR1_9AGAM|nr:uncharacterized protein BJ212DRAFT_887360 [Suillus subaureus]KAG1791639.1 hypothetical protein BJ212DRAFT_887360 [Suillus subaureus]
MAAVLSTLGFSTLLTRLHMVSLLQKVQIAVLIPSPRRVLNFSAWPRKSDGEAHFPSPIPACACPVRLHFTLCAPFYFFRISRPSRS